VQAMAERAQDRRGDDQSDREPRKTAPLEDAYARGPRDVELLLDAQRPEVRDDQRDRTPAPQTDRPVEDVAPGRRRRRPEEEREADVVERKDPQRPPRVEDPVVVGPRARVDQDAGDEESRQDKEEVHAGPAKSREEGVRGRDPD